MSDIQEQKLQSHVAKLEAKLLRLEQERDDALAKLQAHLNADYSAGEVIADSEIPAETIRNLALFPEENPYPVMRVDSNGELLYANRAANKLLKQWRCGVGTNVPDVVCEKVQEVIASDIPGEMETGCGGREFLFSLVPIIERNYVNFYGRDITDRKRAQASLVKSEGLLKRAQEIARLGSWEYDLTVNTLSWSDEVYRIFGLNPQEFGASYEAFLETVHPDDREAVSKAYGDSLEEGHTGYEIEHRIIRQDTGEERYVHEKCEHFRDSSGKVVRSVGMVHDITGRIRRELEICRLNMDLEARARELETFNYTVAHDLRKPLTVISGYCDVLSEICPQLDEKSLRYFNEIQSGTVKMSELIEALLDFSMIAHMETTCVDVDLTDLAKATVAELELAEPERLVTIKVAEGMKFQGDPNLLRIVLNNLIGNAWKFTESREDALIEVGVTTVHDIETCFVRDNGTGFEINESENLFAPFQRLNGSEITPGFGIGLATVERIVERHNGRVWAESQPGKGATFCFSLGG